MAHFSQFLNLVSPYKFSALIAVFSTNIIIRKISTEIIPYFKEEIDEKHQKLIKAVIDESANHWVYQAVKNFLPHMYATFIPQSYNDQQFIYKASAPILAAAFIQTLEPIINVGINAYENSDLSIQTLQVYARHTIGQLSKFYFLSNHDDSNAVNIMEGGAICYFIRAVIDKLYFNYHPNHADEIIIFSKSVFNKLLSESNINKIQQNEIFEQINATLASERKLIVEELKNKTFSIINVRDIFEKIQKQHKILDDNIKQDLFISAQKIIEKNLDTIATNHLFINSLQVATDSVIGAFNNLASKIAPSSNYGQYMFGSFVRSSEAGVKFTRDELLNKYFKTPYDYDINSAIVDQNYSDSSYNFSTYSFPIPNSSPKIEICEIVKMHDLIALDSFMVAQSIFANTSNAS